MSRNVAVVCPTWMQKQTKKHAVAERLLTKFVERYLGFRDDSAQWTRTNCTARQNTDVVQRRDRYRCEIPVNMDAASALLYHLLM